MRALPALQLNPETPIQWAETTEVRQDAVESWELHRCHLGQGLWRDQHRREELAAEREDVLDTGEHAGARMPLGIEPDLEGHAHGGPDVVGERHLGAQRKVRAEDPEAFVRVDPPAARWRDRHDP